MNNITSHQPGPGINILRVIREHGPARIREIDRQMASRLAELHKLAEERKLIEAGMKVTEARNAPR